MSRFWPSGDPLRVLLDETAHPAIPILLYWRGVEHRVCDLADRWQVDTEWWQGRIAREYFKLTTDTGWLLVIYHDQVGGDWYLQRAYD